MRSILRSVHVVTRFATRVSIREILVRTSEGTTVRRQSFRFVFFHFSSPCSQCAGAYCGTSYDAQAQSDMYQKMLDAFADARIEAKKSSTTSATKKAHLSHAQSSSAPPLVQQQQQQQQQSANLITAMVGTDASNTSPLPPPPSITPTDAPLRPSQNPSTSTNTIPITYIQGDLDSDLRGTCFLALADIAHGGKTLWDGFNAKHAIDPVDHHRGLLLVHALKEAVAAGKISASTAATTVFCYLRDQKTQRNR